MRFSDNVDSLEPSATLAIAARARQLRAEGRSVIDLSAGEPMFRVPEYAARAGIRAIEDGETGYPPTRGIPELREAVARYLARTTASGGGDPDRILVSNGVKQALFNSVFCLFGSGDEVLVPAPYWTSYLPQLRLAGAEPVVVERSWDDGFALDLDRLEAARSDRTRGLILNSPGNPTGAVFGPDLLGEVAGWADRHGIWLLSDEIYRRLHYGEGPAPSVLDLEEVPPRTVVFDGVSKAFAMPGFRIGFAAGPPELIGKASDLQGQTTTGAATPSQHAAAAAFGEEGPREEALDAYLEALSRRRSTAVELLGGSPGLEVRPPPGGMFVFARVRGERPSAEVAEALLMEAGVATIPGEAFGGAGHLRLNFAVDEDVLEEGLERTVDFFAAA